MRTEVEADAPGRAMLPDTEPAPEPVQYRESVPESVPQPEKDALQDAMERTIASLQLALDEKEQALLQSKIATAGLQQKLEQTRTQSENLKKKLTTVVKAHETLAQKPAATPTETEIAQMKEQWRIAQKSMQREHGRLQGELARAKAGLHQATQDLEAQTRARRSEAAHASLQIANLEREISAARAATATAVTSREGRMWIRLSATAAATAVFMAAMGFWWRFEHDGANQKPVEGPVASAATPIRPVAHRVAGSIASSAGTGDSPFQRGGFQKALGRLNNSLSSAVGATPEQILRAVRVSNSKTDPNVCNFQWNNGQPSLFFGGTGSNTLGDSLEQCATAVDRYLQPSGALALKK